MVQLFEQAAEWIQQLVMAIGYPGIFLAAFIEAIFPPLPSELVMPFSGFLVARGELNFIGAVLASTLGAVVGSIPMYYLGRWADAFVIRRFLRRYGRVIGVSEAELDRAMRVFSRYGEAVVFFGRLLPLIRTLISIPAGMNRMPLPRFLLYTTAGTFLWMAALTYAGVVLGENWEQVLIFIERWQGVIAVVGLGLLLGFVAVIARRRVRRS